MTLIDPYNDVDPFAEDVAAGDLPAQEWFTEKVEAAPWQPEAERDPDAIALLPSFDALSPAARIAALTALRDAFDAIATLEKARLIDSLLGTTDDNQPIATELGPISFRPGGKQTMKIDGEQLLAFVREHIPDGIITRTVEEVDPEVHQQVVDSLTDLGDGTFVYDATGEVVDFAHLSEPSSPQVSYPSSKLQKLVKAQARHVVARRLGDLSAPMLVAAHAGDIDRYVAEVPE